MSACPLRMSSSAVGGPDSERIGRCQGAHSRAPEIGQAKARSGLPLASGLLDQAEQLAAHGRPGEVRVDLRILFGLQATADVVDRRAVAGLGEFKRPLENV